MLHEELPKPIKRAMRSLVVSHMRLADGGSSSQFKLLCWDGKEARIDQSIVRKEADGSEQRIYRPAKVDPTITRAIIFPTQVTDYGSNEYLLKELFSLIQRFSRLEESDARLLCYAVLASWLVEFTPVPVSLAFLGAPSPERRQLLRLLRCLFRRAIILGEANVGALCSLPMEIAPALFIERCEPNAQLLRFLEATNSCDTQVVRRGRILNAGCAKVLCSEEPLAGIVPGWPALQISMCDVSEPLPYLDSREQQRIIEGFQPKLEMFRLKNFVLALSACPNVSDVSPVARELAFCLSACVAGDLSQSLQLSHLLKLHRPITPSTKLVTLFNGRRIGHGVRESSSSPTWVWPV